MAARITAMEPAYEGEKASFPGGRALIITTSHDRLGDKGSKKTGVFGSEMTAPYYVFKDGGMQVDLASIKGGPIPIDPMSFKWFLKTEYDDRYLMDAEFQQKASRSMRIDDVDVSAYDIIYMAGGWGAAYDLGTSAVLGGDPLVKGRRLTAVTDKQVQELGITMTPQHPERELRTAGALFESETAFRDLFANHIVVDSRLVTGQNQNAGVAVAHKMMIAAKGDQ